jgi:Kef-type K+ transport system membrane component KefB
MKLRNGICISAGLPMSLKKVLKNLQNAFLGAISGFCRPEIIVATIVILEIFALQKTSER